MFETYTHTTNLWRRPFLIKGKEYRFGSILCFFLTLQKVDQAGLCQDTSAAMTNRILHYVRYDEYDWFIVEGGKENTVFVLIGKGCNDLASEDATTIFNNLISIQKLLQTNGRKVVLMTIPGGLLFLLRFTASEISKKEEKTEDVRKKVNDELR